MKYRVADTPFNRANYPDMVGKLYDVPPGYAAVLEVKETSTCPAGLIELKNALKKELSDETDASSRYREAAAKLTHYGYGAYASIIKSLSQDESRHQGELDRIVSEIEKECEA